MKIMKLIVIFFIIVSILVSAVAINFDEWNKVKDEETIDSAFVFSLFLHSWFETEYLEDNEFLFGDIIDYCHISVLERKPKDLSITATKIIFTSPSKQLYEKNLSGHTDFFKAGKFTYSIEEALVHLNESGLWSVKIIFNENIPFSFLYSNDAIFTNSSEIHIFRGLNINVYSNLEYQQLKAAKALEKSAKATEESKIYSIISIVALSVAAGIAALSLIYSWKTKLREIRANCKDRVSEDLLNIIFLQEDIFNLLVQLEKKNYNYSSVSPKYSTYEKIKDRYSNLIKKYEVGLVYVFKFPEVKELKSKINDIFLDLKNFNDNYLDKLSQPTENTVKDAWSKLKELDLKIRKFLVHKI